MKEIEKIIKMPYIIGKPYYNERCRSIFIYHHLIAIALKFYYKQ